MSGHSSTTICPNCGKDMSIYTDWKPFDYTSSECSYCGFYCYPQIGYLTLEELNNNRQDNDMKPLKKLPKQEFAW